ncbi:MAG TPA: MlaD family protein [Terriglobia bacterium]|nr:MlaD family protein [Terriglobia bacterium]
MLFGLGLFMIGDRRMLFSRSADFYAEFSQVSGLETGAKVRVGGMDAGEIVDIHVPDGPGSKFRLKFSVVSKLFPVIRNDSIASIQTDGLLGNKFLLIDRGTTDMAAPGSILRSREPFEIGDVLAKIRETVTNIDSTVGDVKGHVTDATRTVAETAKHVDEIIVAAQAPIDKFMTSASKISEDTSVLIARVRAGEGTIGKLMNDDAVYQNIAGSAKQIEGAMENLRQTSADVQELVSRFKSGSVPADIERIAGNVSESSERLKVLVASFQPLPGGGDGVAGDLRATLTSSRQAMSDLAEDLEALKHSFFFRGFFKDRGFYDLGSLSPAEYQSKQFEKSVTKERAWVQQNELFIVTDAGVEELSVPGRKKLDATMATFLQYTKDRAVIVEGYAAGGTVAEQFLVSRERAAKVRDYLVKKFTISPEHIGVMPMGSAGGEGDGIALVLLKK